MVDIDISLCSHIKEDPAWAADKWLWVISTITNSSSKELKGTKE